MKNNGYLYVFSSNSFYYEEADLLKEGRASNQIIRTIVADDHPYLIDGVEADLNKDSQIKIISTAESYDALLERVKELTPNIVLLDLKMPGQDKYNLKDFICTLKSLSDCKVIVFSSETGWARINRCLEIGASAYIEKAISIGKLAHFIHRVFENKEIIIYTAEQLPDVQVSKRQKEILHYMVDGKENNEIASLLNIDIKTVQSYINEIKSKFSEAFGIKPVKPRTLLLLASKLGFGTR